MVSPDPVHADTVITGVVPADYGGPDTEVMGTVTNTGSAVAGYAVELLADNGLIARLRPVRASRPNRGLGRGQLQREPQRALGADDQLAAGGHRLHQLSSY